MPTHLIYNNGQSSTIIQDLTVRHEYNIYIRVLNKCLAS